MKAGRRKASARARKGSGDIRIQFAAPKAMAEAIDRIRREARDAGMVITRSHVVRCGVAKYLTGLGLMEQPEELAALAGR